MDWDYAELSKAAKKAGGPEKLVEMIEKMAKNEGKHEMIPVVAGVGAGALALGVGITIGIAKIRDHFKKKEAESKAELEKAKKEIVDGITEYDKEQVKIADENKTTNIIEKKKEDD